MESVRRIRLFHSPTAILYGRLHCTYDSLCFLHSSALVRVRPSACNGCNPYPTRVMRRGCVAHESKRMARHQRQWCAGCRHCMPTFSFDYCERVLTLRVWLGVHHKWAMAIALFTSTARIRRAARTADGVPQPSIAPTRGWNCVRSVLRHRVTRASEGRAGALGRR